MRELDICVPPRFLVEMEGNVRFETLVQGMKLRFTNWG